MAGGSLVAWLGEPLGWVLWVCGQDRTREALRSLQTVEATAVGAGRMAAEDAGPLVEGWIREAGLQPAESHQEPRTNMQPETLGAMREAGWKIDL